MRLYLKKYIITMKNKDKYIIIFFIITHVRYWKKMA